MSPRDAFGVERPDLISKGIPSALRGLSHPVSSTVKDATAAKYMRLRLNAHTGGKNYPRHKNQTTPNAFTNGQIIGHSRSERTRARTLVRTQSKGRLKDTRGRVLP